MRVYYNEFDPFAASWLLELMGAGLIPWGRLDDRDMTTILPSELKGYTRCHFFAGIAGWELALQLAGWPRDREVWTGSCPCQPFSKAGRRKGTEDERHLWPDWFRFIRKHRPATIFGEQVADAKDWLDRVFADLEALDYSCGAAIIPACAVDAPHQRKRIWFVADSSRGRYRPSKEAIRTRRDAALTSRSIVADTDSYHSFWWTGPLQVGWNTLAGKAETSSQRGRTQWRIKPGLSLLADGISNRVERCRGFGNAIVPQVAATFIKAFLETES